MCSRRCARRTPTGSSCGRGCARTTSRSSRPTTARSTSTARRSWAWATSGRSQRPARVEDRVDLLHDGGVVAGRSARTLGGRDLDRPAKLFGLYPRKGAIAVGSDADLVVYDPTGRERSRRRPTTWTSTTRATRAGRCGWGPTSCSAAGRWWSANGEFAGARATAGSSSARRRTTPASRGTRADPEGAALAARSGGCHGRLISSTVAMARPQAFPSRIREGGRRSDA